MLDDVRLENMSSCSFSSLFPSSELVSLEMRTLARIAQVSKELGKKPEGRILGRERLSELAKNLLEVADSFGVDTPMNLSSLKERVQEPLLSHYVHLEQEQISLEKIKEVAKHIQRDVLSLAVIPIKSPRLGKHGPTFLVDYQREIDGTGALNYCAFVIKNINALEMVSNRIYFEFARCGGLSGTGVHYFSVPQTSLIDLTQKKYFPVSGECSEIVEPNSLHKDINQIALCINKSKKFSQMIMLSEKICGQNILDFITSAEYTEASQKRKNAFFFKLGGLSLLDLLMGNLERFFAVDLTSSELLDKNLPANLGNALIVRSEDENILFYAIDNGVSPGLCLGTDERLEWSNRNLRRLYNEVIVNVISSSDGLDGFVANIMHSLALWGHDEKDKFRPSPELKPFFTDFEDSKVSYCASIRAGILEMGLHIKNHIIPFWDGEKSGDLKDFIRSTCNIILNPLKERIKIFDSRYALHNKI